MGKHIMNNLFDSTNGVLYTQYDAIDMDDDNNNGENMK